MVEGQKKTGMNQKNGYKSFDIALISIFVSLNFMVSLYIAPTLNLVIPHVFVGAILMVPFNLFLSYLAWAITTKKIFTLYFLLYGILTMPTTIWGSTPGLFKPILGLLIGLTLDLLTLKSNPNKKTTKTLFGIIFPTIWWLLSGLIWQISGLPINQIFQNMLSSISFLKPFTQQSILITFIIIIILTIPSSIISTRLATILSERIEKDLNLPNKLHKK
ncbi:hypothetical protein FJY84_00925 [Candidatus Bathyarchaeota archaeon]|nr:hypothetical protein [Candidatus Bathyarchaeota archaeon]